MVLVDGAVDHLEEDVGALEHYEDAAVEPVFTYDICKDLEDELMTSKKHRKNLNQSTNKGGQQRKLV